MDYLVYSLNRSSISSRIISDGGGLVVDENSVVVASSDASISRATVEVDDPGGTNGCFSAANLSDEVLQQQQQLQTSDYLTELFREKFNDATVIVSVVVLVLINFVVIAGNILVILSVFTSAKLRTVTNFFIVSLAVADFLVGIAVLPYSLTLEILDTWIFGEYWCQGWLTIDVWMCTASILNLCAISVDRYLAVTQPVRYRSMMTAKRAKYIIAAVWVLSFIICLPLLVVRTREMQSMANAAAAAATGTGTGNREQVLSNSAATYHMPPPWLNPPPPPLPPEPPENSRITTFTTTSAPVLALHSHSHLHSHHSRNHNHSHRSQQQQISSETLDIPTLSSRALYLSLNDLHSNDPPPSTPPPSSLPPPPYLLFTLPRFNKSTFSLTPPASLTTTISPPQPENTPSTNSSTSILNSTNSQTFKPTCTSPRPPPVQCALFLNKSYVIYSAFGSFYIPMLFMLFFYWRIYLVASRTTRALKRGYRTTKTSGGGGSDNVGTGNEERLTLRIHRGTTDQESSSANSSSRNKNSSSRWRRKRNKTGSGESDESREGGNPAQPTRLRTRIPITIIRAKSSTGSIKGSSGKPSLTINNSDTSGGLGGSMRVPNVNQQQQQTNTLSPSDGLGSEVNGKNRRNSPGNQSTLSLPSTSSPCSSREGSARSTGGGGGSSCSSKQVVLARLSKRTSKYQAKRFHAETKAAKTVGIIVGGFIVCWLPFFTVYLARAFCGDCISDLLFSIFFWLGYCNSMINPCIYGLFSRDFRRAFRNILCRCKFSEEITVSSLIRQIHMPTFFEDMNEEMDEEGGGGGGSGGSGRGGKKKATNELNDY